MKSIKAISKEIEILEGLRDFGDITTEQSEYLAVLNCCYELIARTAIIEAETVKSTPDMLEPGDPEIWPAYMHGVDDTVEAFVFNLITGKGFDLRRLVKYLVFGRQQKIADEAGIRRATLSDYLTGKKQMTAQNIEKVVNYCLLHRH